jgi:hypothetical protein
MIMIPMLKGYLAPILFILMQREQLDALRGQQAGRSVGVGDRLQGKEEAVGGIDTIANTRNKVPRLT